MRKKEAEPSAGAEATAHAKKEADKNAGGVSGAPASISLENSTFTIERVSYCV